MRFLKWLTRTPDLSSRVLELEERNKDLVEQVTKQNETLQEVIVCIRKLAEVDQNMYHDILLIADSIKLHSGEDSFDDYFHTGLEKEKDEYLN